MEILNKYHSSEISYKNLESSFRNAGQILNWDKEKYGNSAIGIFQNEWDNKNKKVFIVKIDDINYIIERNIVENFIRTNEHIYHFNEKTIYNVPTRLWKILKK